MQFSAKLCTQARKADVMPSAQRKEVENGKVSVRRVRVALHGLRPRRLRRGDLEDKGAQVQKDGAQSHRAEGTEEDIDYVPQEHAEGDVREYLLHCKEILAPSDMVHEVNALRNLLLFAGNNAVDVCMNHNPGLRPRNKPSRKASMDEETY